MGVTFEVVDPATGQVLLLNAHMRRGRVWLRRLPDHLLLAHASPARLQRLMEFGEAAREARGSRGLVEGLPPAAALVREMPRRTRQLPVAVTFGGINSNRLSQASLRALVPDSLWGEVERMARYQTRIRLRRA